MLMDKLTNRDMPMLMLTITGMATKIKIKRRQIKTLTLLRN